MTITAKNIGDALSATAAIAPDVFATYQVMKAIWMAAHPGASEADYITSLVQASGTTTTDSDQILMAKGYVRDPATGLWSKPPAAAVGSGTN